MYLPAPQPFRLEADWLNAQAFRWTERDGWFYGIVGGQLIRVRNDDGDRIEFEGKAAPDAVKRYFRLDQDIERVHATLTEADPEHMPQLIKDYGHIRVLRQDPWECLVAYICSRQARVERITDMVETLADKYGKPLNLNGEQRKSFPSAQRLAKVGEAELNGLRFGLKKASTIHEVATDVTTGALDLRSLAESEVPLAEARARLKNSRKGKGKRNGYPGIGPKIADCVCLFSLGKDDAFPVDRHIKAALARIGKDARWARRTFGDHAGYAGQLLFLDQRSRIRERQREARYASEDSTIVIHPGVRLDPGEHPHDFEEVSFLHIHDGWDKPHTHPKSEWPSGWEWE